MNAFQYSAIKEGQPLAFHIQFVTSHKCLSGKSIIQTNNRWVRAISIEDAQNYLETVLSLLDGKNNYLLRIISFLRVEGINEFLPWDWTEEATKAKYGPPN